MTTPPEVPEGRCMVCRVAWEPCRRCRGKVLRAKCEATMERIGTRRHPVKRGEGIRFGLPPEEFRHYRKRDDNANTDT